MSDKNPNEDFSVIDTTDFIDPLKRKAPPPPPPKPPEPRVWIEGTPPNMRIAGDVPRTTTDTTRSLNPRPSRYRILKRDGKFYPQVRKSWFLFSWWGEIKGDVNPNDPGRTTGPIRAIRDDGPTGGGFAYTLFKEYAEARCDAHAKRTAKPKSIIHPYTPKQ